MMKSIFYFFLACFLPINAYGVPAPAPGKYLSSQPVSLETARTRCVVDFKLDAGKSEASCLALKFQQLGEIDAIKVFAGWYKRTGRTKGMVVETEQVALFESSTGDELTPIWTDVVEVYGETQAVTGIELIHSPLGTFVEIKYYSGGTAGAWSEFFLWRAGKWIYIAQDLDGDAAKCLPKDYGIQAKTIDLQRKVAEIFAPNDNDPNCCPSGRITLNLSLVGDRLQGKNCSFRKEHP